MHTKLIIKIIAVIFGIWLLRCLLEGTLTIYAFLWWNIILALIPLFAERAIISFRKKYKGVSSKVGVTFFSGVWLLFLPNAFYLLTDFMHLNPQALVNKRNNENHYAIEYMRGDGIYILDSLLLVCVAIFGAVVGGLALNAVYTYFAKLVGKHYSVFITGIIMMLVSLGVYIGRYGRWNSWDALFQPHVVIMDTLSSLTDGTTLHRFITVVVAILVAQVLSLYCMRRYIMITRLTGSNNAGH